MSDIADIGNQTAQDALDRSINAARGVRSLSVDPSKASADECTECGYLIASERQIAVPGCQLCTECADRLERRLRVGL